MIKEIEITNVKGIEHKLFALDILPNHPSILVAPNGFGKSSFATAFNSLYPRKIILDKLSYNKNDAGKTPELKIKYQESNGAITLLEANSTKNDISKKIGCFVINSKVIAKSIASFGGKAAVRLGIDRIILMEGIGKTGSETYIKYKQEKDKINELFSCFGSTWKGIVAKKDHDQLVVDFPLATEISNGQRDILTFICMLSKANLYMNKNVNILIIDEVFDYLDDANLVTAQYYISNFIDEYKTSCRALYPLILTHLDPNYFRNYTFSNQKVYYLEQSSISVNKGIEKLLRTRQRDDISEQLKDNISHYLLHYAPEKINNRSEFRLYDIPESWGEGDNFAKFIDGEIQKYMKGDAYDPFAVCGALRVKIEKIVYEKLPETKKQEFVDTHITRKKLEFADANGVHSPESYYLLGIIYNEGMHWIETVDNVSKIVTKLKHPVIKNMIKRIYV